MPDDFTYQGESAGAQWVKQFPRVVQGVSLSDTQTAQRNKLEKTMICRYALGRSGTVKERASSSEN
jgi:hypothetical protein